MISRRMVLIGGFKSILALALGSVALRAKAQGLGNDGCYYPYGPYGDDCYYPYNDCYNSYYWNDGYGSCDPYNQYEPSGWNGSLNSPVSSPISSLRAELAKFERNISS